MIIVKRLRLALLTAISMNSIARTRSFFRPGSGTALNTSRERFAAACRGRLGAAAALRAARRRRATQARLLAGCPPGSACCAHGQRPIVCGGGTCVDGPRPSVLALGFRA